MPGVGRGVRRPGGGGMGPSVASGSAFTCAPPNGAVLRGDRGRAWDLFFSLLAWDSEFQVSEPRGAG